MPAGTDIRKHNIVLIWCKDFSVLFGSAVLI
ncbi:MAG TPA: DM13 domain-containing protein [Bacteroidia bacterium]|nr:DM13 domain-containing protein [Bacteroidia bacterium]